MAIGFHAQIASAADYVVFASQNTSLKPGQVFKGNQNIRLAAGQSLRLITPDKQVLALTGPFTQFLSAADTPQHKVAMPPDPWLIDVNLSVDWCLRDRDPVVLWRPNDTKETPITMARFDGSWSANSIWPSGYKKINFPSFIPIHESDIFAVEIAGKTKHITFHMIPTHLTNFEGQIAWMMNMKCSVQALLLRHHFPAQ